MIAKLEPLLDFIHIQSKKTGNTIETPLDDPQGWRVATDLAWFATEEAERFVRSNSEIKNLKNVFGFAAQMHKNCAFIYRRGGGENGSHFVAYVPVVEPTVTSILLDATADIDGVGDLCPWRTNVAVPQVRYDNLHIVHVEPYTRDNLAEYFQREPNRLKYTEHAQQVIRGLMPAGASGLVVCKQTLVDHGHFPNTHAFAFPWKVFPWKFEDRHLAVTWWGGHGIGVNDWKEADYVFHFGEHILPDRSMFALVQGLRMQEATTGMLGATKNSELSTDHSNSPDYLDGYLDPRIEQVRPPATADIV